MIDPSLFPRLPPVVQNDVPLWTMVTTNTQEDGYYKSASAKWDREHFGSVHFLVQSCGLSFSGAGVSLESDPGGQPFYLVDAGSSSTTLTKTNALSVGGFVNSPVGLGTFTATLRDRTAARTASCPAFTHSCKPTPSPGCVFRRRRTTGGSQMRVPRP